MARDRWSAVLKKHLGWVVAVAIVVVISLWGCGTGLDGSGGKTHRERLRAINAVVRETILHIELGNKLNITSDLNFGQVSPYMEIPEGMVPVRVRVDRDILPVIESTLTIGQETDSTYLIFKQPPASATTTATATPTATTGTAAKALTSPTATPEPTPSPVPTIASPITALLITDDTIADPLSGFFRIKFINVAIDSGLDIYITLPSVPLSKSLPVYSAVKYGTATPSIDLEQGSYRIRFTESGSRKVLFDSGGVEFADQQIRTVMFLEDREEGQPYSTLLLDDKN